MCIYMYSENHIETNFLISISLSSTTFHLPLRSERPSLTYPLLSYLLRVTILEISSELLDLLPATNFLFLCMYIEFTLEYV